VEVNPPPRETPAREAFLFQGPLTDPNALPNPYPGVDKWVHPRQDIPTGVLLAQFDFRLKADIEQGTKTASNFFTDQQTLRKVLTLDNKIDAQALGEALQVRPFRLTDTGPHQYSLNVALYEVQRPIQARNVQLAQMAEFTHGQSRNNIQFGSGIGHQFYLSEAQDRLLTGPSAALKVVGVISCTNRDHRLGWLTKMEQAGLTNDQIRQQINPVFQQMVKDLHNGSPSQQQQAQAIKGLFDANQQLKTVAHAKQVLVPPGGKVSPIIPVPKPTPQRRRGPHL
jgi:hypothetical protein